MDEKELKDYMSFFVKRQKIQPLSVLQVNNDYIVAIYKGQKSDADILIKYRQKLKTGKWSRIRTPKHIHWTVDILIKMFQNKELTEQFINELLKIWKSIKPVSSEEREHLDLKELLNYDTETLEKFKELSKYGEYSIKFLLLLAKLLMIQEKTNYPEGKLFQTLLRKLKKGEDIFTILQTATLRKL